MRCCPSPCFRPPSTTSPDRRLLLHRRPSPRSPLPPVTPSFFLYLFRSSLLNKWICYFSCLCSSCSATTSAHHLHRATSLAAPSLPPCIFIAPLASLNLLLSQATVQLFASLLAAAQHHLRQPAIRRRRTIRRCPIFSSPP